MEIIALNTQGGKNPHALAELIYLKNKFRPDIIFIFETLTNSRNSNKILNTLHFENKIIIDPVSHCGGLWVCWNNANIILNTKTTTPRYAKLTITYKPTAKTYSIIGAYCPAQESEKQTFWDQLAHDLQQITVPWLLLGDFNEMLSYNNKLGGRPLLLHQLKRLPHLLTHTNAIDIPCLQKAYFWKSNLSNQLIYERLDRAIAHQTFRNEFPNGTITYGNFSVSDHAPVFYSSNDTQKTTPSLLRYTNFWALEKQSHTIVQTI